MYWFWYRFGACLGLTVLLCWLMLFCDYVLYLRAVLLVLGLLIWCICRGLVVYFGLSCVNLCTCWLCVITLRPEFVWLDCVNYALLVRCSAFDLLCFNVVICLMILFWGFMVMWYLLWIHLLCVYALDCYVLVRRLLVFVLLCFVGAMICCWLLELLIVFLIWSGWVCVTCVGCLMFCCSLLGISCCFGLIVAYLHWNDSLIVGWLPLELIC